MANLKAPVRLQVSPTTIFGDYLPNATSDVILDFARVTTTQNIGQCYYHIKTNLMRGSDQMYMIEAEGYNYGKGQAIRCSWCGYLYSATALNNPLINTGNHTSTYLGLTADSQYISADNYLVIVASSSTSYFSGFNLSCYRLSPGSTNGGGSPVTMLAWTLSASSGAQY